MKLKLVFILFLIWSTLPLVFAQEAKQVDTSATSDIVKFNPEILNKKKFLKRNLSLIRLENFLISIAGYELIGKLEYTMPFSTLIPFVKTGIGFSPFVYTYGGGINIKIIDFLWGVGYLGSFDLLFQISSEEFTILNRRNFIHLGYLNMEYNFFIFKLRNYFAYGLSKINRVVDVKGDESSIGITEQIINELVIDILVFSDFKHKVEIKNTLRYKYFFSDQVYIIDYSLFLETIIKFDNLMELGIVPKLALASSSNQEVVRNKSSFFKISPLSYDLFLVQSFGETQLNGIITMGFDLGYRIFPFSYILNSQIFKGIFFQPSIYTGWVLKERKMIDKSQVGVSLVLNMGYRSPYDKFKFTFGVGWNNYEKLILNLGGVSYY